MYVRIQNGEVVEELAALPANFTHPNGDITVNFPALTEEEHRAAGYYPLHDAAPAVVNAWEMVSHTGYTIGENLVSKDYAVVPVMTIGEYRAKRKEALAAHRYSIEIGGVYAGGVTIATDDRSKSLLTGARVRAEADNTRTFKWKGVDGFVELTAAQIIAISDIVAEFVEHCFANEALHADALDALDTFQDIKEYDITTG